MNEFNGEWYLIKVEGNTYYGGLFKAENLILNKQEIYFYIYGLDKESIILCDQVLHNVINSLEKSNISKLSHINFRIFGINLNDMIKISKHFNNHKGLSCVLEKELKYSGKIIKNEKALKIRNATLKDKEFIENCVIKAYINGTDKSLYSDIGEQQFINNIVTYHDNIINSKNLVITAEYHNQFAGYIAFDLEGIHLNTKNKYPLMIDIYVINQFKDKSIEKHLINEAENKLYDSGYHSIIGTIDIKKRAHDKYISKTESLIEKNWSINSLLISI